MWNSRDNFSLTLQRVEFPLKKIIRQHNFMMDYVEIIVVFIQKVVIPFAQSILEETMTPCEKRLQPRGFYNQIAKTTLQIGKSLVLKNNKNEAPEIGSPFFTIQI